MPYQSKDWKMNDLIKEEDLDHIEQGLQETSVLAETNAETILKIENILKLEEDSILKTYIDTKNNGTLNSIPLIDNTLTKEGQSAEASVVGENFEMLFDTIDSINSFIGFESDAALDINNRLKLIESNVAVLNILEAQAIRDDAAASAAAAAASATQAASSASAAANNSIDGIRQYLYWKAGDVFQKTISEKENSMMFWCCPGFLSSSSQSIHFTISMGKPIIASKIEVSNLEIFVRSVEGYIWKNWNGGFIPVGSPTTVNIVSPQTGTISIRVDYSKGWNIAGSKKLSPNNRPCSVTLGKIKIKFTD